jgi:hypothetical protein
MDERLFSEVVAELQGVHIDPERGRRAAAAATAIQHKIAVSALARLAFDDSPADYTALLLRGARKLPGGR